VPPIRSIDLALAWFSWQLLASWTCCTPPLIAHIFDAADEIASWRRDHKWGCVSSWRAWRRAFSIIGAKRCNPMARAAEGGGSGNSQR